MTDTIYVQNASTVLTETQTAAMTRACAYQARWQFAPAWGRQPTAVLYLAKGAAPPAGAQVIVILDDSDQAGALGYHSEGDNGVAYGRVFAKPSLDAGSTVFGGPYAVSATLSHEVLEFIADPAVSYWAVAGQDSTGAGAFYAFEVCDAVEDRSYQVRDLKTSINVSDFLLPAWFDPQASKGPFDYLHALHAPFSLTPGGYVVTWTGAQQTQVFGDELPAWRRDQKRHELSRGGRRVGVHHG